MGRALRRNPKSILLVWLLNDRDGRAGLRYDFRTRFGLPIEVVTSRRMRWAEAWDLVDELLRDRTSHTFAAANRWAFVPTAADLAGYDQLEMWANAKRKKNSVPIRLERPWLRGRPQEHDEGNTTPDPHRAERRARLDEITSPQA